MSTTVKPVDEGSRELGFRVPIRAKHVGAVRAGITDLEGRLDGREVVCFSIDPEVRTGFCKKATAQ